MLFSGRDFWRIENLAQVLGPAIVKRVMDGQTERNGVGSARTLQPVPLPPCVETVTEYQENGVIVYKIIKRRVLRYHLLSCSGRRGHV